MPLVTVDISLVALSIVVMAAPWLMRKLLLAVSGGGHIYVYSAYCMALPGETGPCSQVQLLAAVHQDTSLSAYTCKLW